MGSEVTRSAAVWRARATIAAHRRSENSNEAQLAGYGAPPGPLSASQPATTTAATSGGQHDRVDDARRDGSSPPSSDRQRRRNNRSSHDRRFGAGVARAGAGRGLGRGLGVGSGVGRARRWLGLGGSGSGLRLDRSTGVSRSAVSAPRYARTSSSRSTIRDAAAFSGSMASARRASSRAPASSPRSSRTRARPTTAIEFFGSASATCAYSVLGAVDEPDRHRPFGLQQQLDHASSASRRLGEQQQRRPVVEGRDRR